MAIFRDYSVVGIIEVRYLPDPPINIEISPLPSLLTASPILNGLVRPKSHEDPYGAPVLFKQAWGTLAAFVKLGFITDLTLFERLYCLFSTTVCIFTYFLQI